MFPQNTYFYIKSVQNGCVIDVYNGETSADTELIIWPQKYNDNENQIAAYASFVAYQLWRFEGGYLINQKSNLVMDIRGGKHTMVYEKKMEWDSNMQALIGDITSDKPIIQYDRKMTAAENQRWAYSNGFVHVASNPRLVLDIKGGSDKKGTKVILYERKDSDNANQQWTIEPFGQPTDPYGTGAGAQTNPYGGNPYGTAAPPPPQQQQQPPQTNVYGNPVTPYGNDPSQPGMPGTCAPGYTPYGTPAGGLAGYNPPVPYEQAAEVHRQVYQEQPEKKAHLSHQLIAGAAAFEAVKAYRRHQEAKGEEVSHGFIKQSVAALAASQIVKFAEEHDWSSKDKEEATRQAQAAAEHYSTREFGGH
ncbi:ricin B-like lectin [Lichtheimia hyalospora FSU 10163]|nr:ricin B-like lectin [Lichtheimia hyalospora FSU 10163]